MDEYGIQDIENNTQGIIPGVIELVTSSYSNAKN